MRIRTMTVIALTGLGLSGCSLWNKSEKAADVSYTDASLRASPQQAYQFDGQTYAVDVYDAASQYAPSPYAGYAVELFNTQSAYSVAAFSDPRQTEFVKLNGQSEPIDWQNCETRHRGYLFMSEYDFILDPGFEVCMRNKGYVLSTEYGAVSKRTLTAQTAGLRGVYTSPAPRSAYPAFFP